MSRLYIVTLLIYIICRVHHEKHWTGWSTSWNQDSVQFSHSVMSHSLRPHKLQHTRPPCPSPTPRVRIGDAIQPSNPPSSPFPPAPNPSQHQSLFQWVNSSHEVAKVPSFSFSISPPKERPGLISSRMDWLYLFAVQGTLKSSPTPQFKSINSSALSFLHSSTLTYIHDLWKTIALTRQTFVGKVISLLFNMLSRLVITFLLRSVF